MKKKVGVAFSNNQEVISASLGNGARSAAGRQRCSAAAAAAAAALAKVRKSSWSERVSDQWGAREVKKRREESLPEEGGGGGPIADHGTCLRMEVC